jgi:hypothetical protein
MVLPQLLVLLLVGGSLDLLGGWNQTDGAMGTLLVLFVSVPLLTLALLVIEFVRCCRSRFGEHHRAMFNILLALGLFVESLAIDLYILSQVRM